MLALAFSRCARHLAVGRGKLWPPSAQPPRFFSIPPQRVALGGPRGTASQQPRVSGSASAVPGELAPGQLIGGKYQVVQVLGRGGSAVTYKCLERGSGGEVAVKALALRRLSGWKQLDLFVREVAVLKTLDHPGIPRYLEYFEEDTPHDRGFYMVQELASGQSLADMVAGGWRGEEAEVERIAGEVLAILQYLGGRRPVVVHRDIKPGNIVMEGGQAGGRVRLVDFGGVQGMTGTGDQLGSTVVGTWGYMAPEQFQGVAQPASDLYSLGATLLCLLSGQPPSAFPRDHLRLNFDEVAMSPRLRLLLGGLLEPLAEDRLTAQQAVALLQGGLAEGWRPSEGSGAVQQTLVGGRVLVTQRGTNLEVEVTPAGLAGFLCLQPPSGTDLFVTGVGVMHVGLAVSAMCSRPPVPLAAACWAICAIFCFIAFGERWWTARTWRFSFLRQRLQLGLGSWVLQEQWVLPSDGGRVDWEAEGGLGRKEARGRVQHLDETVNQYVYYNSGPTEVLLKQSVGLDLGTGDGSAHLGASMRLVAGRPSRAFPIADGLLEVEHQWLAGAIREHIEQLQKLEQGEK